MPEKHWSGICPDKPGKTRKVLTGGGWPIMLLRAILALIIGIYLFIAPDDATTRLGQFLGVFAIIDGIGNAYGAIRGQGGDARIWLLVRGALSIIVGLLLVLLPFQFPDLNGTIWLYLFAFQAVVASLIGLFIAIRARKEIGNVPGMLGYNLAYLALGIFLFNGPSQFGDALIRYSAVTFLAIGVLLLIVALIMRARKGS